MRGARPRAATPRTIPIRTTEIEPCEAARRQRLHVFAEPVEPLCDPDGKLCGRAVPACEGDEDPVHEAAAASRRYAVATIGSRSLGTMSTGQRASCTTA